MNNKQIRIPRPQGITYLSSLYNKSKDEDILKRLRELVLKQYITNGFQELTIEELSKYLGVKESEISVMIGDMSKELLGVQGLLNGGGRVIFERVIQKVLEVVDLDRAQILSQLQRIKRAQGKSYKPFVTQSFNQVLDLSLKSQKGYFELLKALNPPSTSINLEQNAYQNHTQFTVVEALKVIEENDKSDIKALESSYLIPTLPNIEATSAGEVESSKEITLIRKQSEKIGHSDRREAQLEIVDDDNNIPE